MSDRYNIIGKPFPRVDGEKKVTGRTMYADDLTFPQMLFAKIKRSPIPHGRIAHIDTSKAEQIPGVKLIVTGQDLPIPFGIFPVSQDEHALCPDKVRFVGDPVVAIAAVSEDIAAIACDAVIVEYEQLPTYSTLDDAIRCEGEPVQHYAKEGNLHKKISMQFGDVPKALSESEHLQEDYFFYEGNTHLPLEQHCAVALPSEYEGVTVYSSTQTPHYLHRTLTKVLNIPASTIRVIACSVGGGFGGKTEPFNHEVIAAYMARALKKPVKIALDREEVFYCHRGRHPVLMHLTTGVDKDGKIKGQHLQTALDGGAYGSYGVASTFYTGALQTVTYDVPKYRFDSIRAFTNKPPCGPKRGHGTPQPRFGLEVQLDKIAAKLKLDPFELRRRNLLEPNSVTANYMQVTTIALGECMDAVEKGSRWKERYGKLPPGKGLGMACSSYLCGAGLPINWNHMPHSGVQIKLDRSGGVAVFCGESEIGQGSDSVLAACVAEVLGIPLSAIQLCVADTHLTPVDLGSYSSRVTMMMGNAAIEAAKRAKDILAKWIAKKWEVPSKELVFAENKVFHCQRPEAAISFREAVEIAETAQGTIGTTGSYTPPRAPGRYRGSGVGPSPAYSYSSAVVEVDVDMETGMYQVKHIWCAHDIGQAINPTLVRGQIEGGIYMGLGEALMEEHNFVRLPPKKSNALVHRAPSMLDYKSPTFHEMPQIDTYLVGTPDPNGPFGGKEVGQGPLLPIMPAVANAIYNAVGVRVDKIPVSPNDVLAGLEKKAKGQVPRIGPKAYPDIDFGTPLMVPTQDEGGDGQAINQKKAGVRTGIGTMKNKEVA